MFSKGDGYLRRKRHTKIIREGEEVLRIEKEIIKDIFALSPEAILIADLKLNVVECNQATLDLLGGATKNEIIGKNINDFVIDRDRRRLMKDINKTLEQGFVKDIEYNCLTKKRDELIVLISLSIVKDTIDNPLYFVAIVKDITKIILSKKRLQAVFDGIKDGILIIDKDYNILMANSAILRMFNKKNFSDLIGENCFNKFYNNERPCDNCPVHKTFKSGNPCSMTKIYDRFDKEKMILNLDVFPIKDKDGTVIQAIEYLKNITTKIKLEEQLVYQERMATIEELASGVAHEIRNPLGNIFTSAQYCLSKYELPEKVKRYLKIILKNSDRANTVIKSLLNLARPRKISFKMADIGNVINKSCILFKAKFLKQHVHLIRRLPRGLPWILLDEEELIEAFSNFILNALDAMPDGGRLTITTYTDFKNNEVVISFLDTGKGICQEDLSKIFQPFFTTKKNGVGLGLSLALQIINNHKGRIKIESKVDHGTEVIIKLPISRA